MLSASIELPPCIDSGFECAIGVTGNDADVFDFSVKSLVKDNVLGILVFSLDPDGEPPRARVTAFSISEVVFRNLKLNLGRRLLMDDLPLEVEGLGRALNLG